jgi:KRAB domain-containing zinc finger protein
MQCRFCLSGKSDLFHITEDVRTEVGVKSALEMVKIFNFNEVTYLFKYFALNIHMQLCFILQPSFIDLPEYVCTECIKSIVISYTFYENSVKSFGQYHPSLKLVGQSEEAIAERPTKSSPEVVKCEKCMQEFKTKAAFLMHSKLHVEHICIFCFNGYSNESDLLAHIQQVHQDRKYKCLVCDAFFSERKLLSRHFRNVHKFDGCPIFCGQCGKKVFYFSQEAFEQHQRQGHHDPINILDDFDFDAEFLDEYLTEISKYKGKSTLLDEEDQESFLRNFNLIKTKTQNSYNPNKMILEEFLDEVLEDDGIWTKYLKDTEEYLLEEAYLEPILEQTNEKHFNCPNCTEKYSKFGLLKIHLAHSHDIMSLVCNDCGAAFNRKDHFAAHRKEHSREDKPEMKGDFNCNLCDTTFGTINGLKQHLKGHTDVQATHLCPYCPKKFTASSNLIDHVRIHTVPTIPCSFEGCIKKFNSKDMMKKHLQSVHLKVKHFYCDQCSKSFSQKGHLEDHKGTHSNKRFLCGLCSQLFSTRSSLKRHLKQIHKQS